jgi:hypothetical protein
MTWVAVGTAAAIGAGTGAVSAAAQGKEGDDILKSALLGGTVGAVTGGIGAAASPGATEVGMGLGEALTEEGIKAASDQTMAEALKQEALTPLTEIGTGINPVPAGLEQIVPTGVDSTFGFSPAEINAVDEGTAMANASGTSPFESTASTGQTPLVPKAAPTPTPEPASNFGIKGAGPNPSTPGPFDTGVRPMVQGNYSAESAGQLQPNFIGSSAKLVPPATVVPPTPVPETNSFLQGAKDVGSWMDSNPFKTGAAAYIGLQQLGAFDPKEAEMPEKKTFKNQYSLSPNFQGGPYSEPNVYEEKRYNYASGGITSLQGGGGPVERMSMANTAMNPQGGLYPMGMIDKTQYATPTQRPVSAEMVSEAPAYERSNPMLMASGGIARYAEGDEVEERPRRYRGNLMGTLDKYSEMIEGKKSGSLPSGKADPYTGEVGTFTDSDADTRLQDAYTASLTRLKKAGKRANVGIAALPTGVQAGSLNLPTNAAGGGIMQANLGSYAAGGNPRLLRGPGDGMSDNIPATISGRQPARLADGEFVVPADVVSHLGNGSTNAGAKKLHAMMDKVRMDRTGKKKQAPAVKARKYMPK